MTDDDRRFATPHFLGPESDLWRYSDAVMHWDCYAKWEQRPRFARMYFDAQREWSERNPFWGIAHSDESLLVTVKPKPVGKVDVMLAATGSYFRVLLRDWEDWLDGEWFEGCHHEIEHEALAAVLPLLRSKFSSAEAAVAAAGMNSYTATDGSDRHV
jgi:hypothetical protein